MQCTARGRVCTLTKQKWLQSRETSREKREMNETRALSSARDASGKKEKDEETWQEPYICHAISARPGASHRH